MFVVVVECSGKSLVLVRSNVYKFVRSETIEWSYKEDVKLMSLYNVKLHVGVVGPFEIVMIRFYVMFSFFQYKLN